MYFLIILQLFQAGYSQKTAKCTLFTNTDNNINSQFIIQGTITLIQKNNESQLLITGDLKGFKPNQKMGFHIHQLGNQENKNCSDFKDHFNPFNKNHGGPTNSQRHVGDLGNVESDANGNVTVNIRDNITSLYTQNNVIGRGIVVHANQDDLMVTTSAGQRLACCKIGLTQYYLELSLLALIIMNLL